MYVIFIFREGELREQHLGREVERLKSLVRETSMEREAIGQALEVNQAEEDPHEESDDDTRYVLKHEEGNGHGLLRAPLSVTVSGRQLTGVRGQEGSRRSKCRRSEHLCAHRSR